MSIKIDKVVKEEEVRAAGYLWTTEEDPTWLRYQVDFARGTMKGFHVSKCDGSIPRVTPFLYDFASPDMSNTYHLQIAMAVFADIGKENMIRSGEEFVEIDVAGQVGAWQDFMSAFDNADSKKVDKDLSSQRFLTYDKDTLIPSGIIRTGKRGSLSMPRASNFRVGARMSGFDALKIAGSGGLPKKLKVGDMGDVDVEQAKDALKHVERPSSHSVAWYGTTDPEVAKYRLQASTSMPILASLIADRQSLATAVDAVSAINPILMETTGLSKASIKRIGKLTASAPAGRIFEAGERITGEDALGVNRARHTQLSGSVPVDMALRYLSDLPPDRTPNDNEAWLKFNDILSAVAIPLYNATSIPVATIMEASKGNWVAFHESLAKAADFDPKDFDRRTMALVTIDALESIEHFNRTAILPQVLASIKDAEQPEPMVSREFVVSGFEAATNLIIGNTKNPAVLMMEISRRYASRIPAMMEIEGKTVLDLNRKTSETFEKYGETAFPLLTDNYTASNGLVVRPLKNGEDLTEESKRLTHCVGSYQSKARRALSHIYSIQNQSGSESLSTFEFSGVEGTDPRGAATALRLVQHRAKSNGTPPEECAVAYKEFLEAVKGGQIDVNLSEINAWRQHIKESGQEAGATHITPATTWKSVLELDWENDDARLEYWAEWGEVLGGKIAKSNNPGVVYTEKVAQELVSAMSPRTAAIMIDQSRRQREEREAEKAAQKEAEQTPMEP
jgi:hypothetical protein